MTEIPSREKSIFLQAKEMTTARERNTFLDKVCAGDSELRQRVEELLESFGDAEAFLEGVAVEAVSDIGVFANHDATQSRMADGPGTVIGPYKLMEKIGEGGFGLVFVAEQQEPIRRRVAVKLVKPGMDSRDVISRFEAERQALALMDHPNIARVLDAGTTDSGRPFFVMELVRGIPITNYCDQSQLSPTERLELFVSVCRAIQHAHQKGIIHRDIKPSNVLVTLHDGEPIIKVIDFGIAKALNQQLTQKTVYTKFTQLIGTPLYMSPEQAEMSGLDVDTRSDIYSLGVLLYEMLTGSTPFDRERLSAAAFDEIRRIIREEEPPKPSTRLSKSGDRLPSLAAQRKMEPAKLSKVVRGELDWIVMKALEKDRNRRYETANGFAADVLRYLSNDRVEACPPTTRYRLQKFARRNKTLIATSAVVAAAMVIGTIISTRQAVRAIRAEARAEVSAAAAKDNETKARKNESLAREHAEQASIEAAHALASQRKLRERAYASDMNVVAEAYAAGAINRMNDLLDNHRSPARDQDERGLEWYHWWRAGHLEQGKVRHPRTASFRHMSVSPDGKTIALSGWPRHLYLYDSQSLCLLRSPMQINGEGSQTCFSPDGNFLVVDGGDGDWRSIGARVFDTKSWEVIAILASGRDNVMAFAMDRPLLAMASLDQIGLWTWDDTNWKLQAKWTTGGKVEELATTPDGNVLIARITSDWDLNTRIEVWDVPTRKLVRTINDGQKHDCIALSPDGSVLAIAERDGEVRLWTLASLVDPTEEPSPIGILPTSTPIHSLAFSPNSKRLVAGTQEERTLIVWHDHGAGFDPSISVTTRAHSHDVSSVAFGTDSNTLFSAARDGYLKIWNLSRCQPYDVIRGIDPNSQVGYVDDNTLIFNDQDGIIQRWDIRSGERNTPLDKQRRYYRIAVSDDGEFLAGVTHDDELRVWKLPDRRVVSETSIDAEADCRLVVSRNGRRVAYTTRAEFGWGAVSLFDFAEEAKPTGVNLGGFGGDSRVHLDSRPAFSPDGHQLLIQRGGFSRSNSHLLDITTDSIEQRYQLSGWGMEICAAFSPDGSTVAIGSGNHDVRIHDAANGELKFALRGHTDPPRSLAFTQDGSRLISAGADSTVRIWKVGTTGGRLLSTLHGHEVDIEFVTVSPHGTSIASVGADGTLLIWRTSSARDVEQDVAWRLDHAVTVGDPNAAQRIAANDPRILSMRAQSHLAAGAWDAAIVDFDRTLELVKDNHYFVQLRAEARIQAGQLNQSLDDWTRLIQLTDNANAEYLCLRGECYLMLGRREDAQADFLQALALGLTAVGQSTELLQRIESSLCLAQAIVPNGAAWRYTTARPPDGWNTGEGDDSSWAVGAAPFGTPIFCKSYWDSPDIWLRKTVTLDHEMGEPLIVRALADDHANVYVNGVLAAHVSGSTERYKTVVCSPEARLRPGENTIAVHCTDAGWDAGAIGVGLYVQGDPTTFGKLLEVVEERNPSVRRVWIQHLVDKGRLQDATTAIGQLAEVYPDDEMISMQAATLYAHAMEFDRFHRHSRESLDRFGETEIPSVAERIAKSCLVARPDESNLREASALADKAITLDPQGERFVPWAQLTKGLCEFRQGNLQSAIEWAQKSNSNAAEQRACQALSLAVLAMARTKLQDRDAAVRAETQLNQFLEEHSPLRTNAKAGGNWHDWLICELFLRELPDIKQIAAGEG